MTLADLGAEVIKVEAPGKGDDTRAWGPPFLAGESTYFLAINRSKLGITLDFKKPRGRELLHRLLELSDILIENFRPGALEKIGLGYEGTHKLHPRLIYCSISGYGHTGPRRMEPGYDVIIQGESGVMSVTGAPDGPPFKMGISIADITCGMYAAQGILAALYQREKTGKGQKIDIALLDSMVSTLTYQAGIFFATGQAPQRMGNRHPSIVPYETFEASDGFFNLGVANDSQWLTLCAALGSRELAEDARFASVALRVKNYEDLRSRLDTILRAKSDSLLLNILPATVAEELKANDSVCPRRYESASVLFTDFVGFTQIAEGMAPEELIAELDACFSRFDAIARKHNLEKIKTIGDSYMAV